MVGTPAVCKRRMAIMIKKIPFTLSLLAVSMLCAVFAGSAFAETTLLAEWLANGVGLTINVGIEKTGTIKLEDTETIAGKSAIRCSGIADGTVGPDGTGEVTRLLNLKGEEVGALGGLALLGTGAGSDCQAISGCAEGTATSPIEVWPIGLPVKGELFLMEDGTFLLLGTPVGSAGYEILCLILGLNAEDECTGTNGEGLIQNSPVTGDASTPAGSRLTPNATCTQSGGKATGVVEETEESTDKLVNGELLTVSSV